MEPAISIIIPCYNQGIFLEEAVSSVLAQQISSWECIIVNDCSLDETADVAAKLAVSDERIRVFKTPQNLGLAAARNFGIEKARALHILPLDADDKISPTYVQNALKIFADDPLTTLVYARAEFFGAQTGEWQLPPYHYGLLFGRNPIYCAAVFRKHDWHLCGGYDTGLRRGLEDWDFWLKILSPESIVVQLPLIGFYYRKHGQSMIYDLVTDQQAFEQTKADMLLRHRDKWLSWSFNYLAPQLEQIQFYRSREKKIASNAVSRWLYKMARAFVNAS